MPGIKGIKEYVVTLVRHSYGEKDQKSNHINILLSQYQTTKCNLFTICYCYTADIVA